MRRDAVIDAARELFIQHGQSGTSVDAIAKRAGVAKGTVYLYFPSKEHIVDAIETQFNARVLDRVQAAARGFAEAGADAITAWCVELAHAYLDQLDTHDMLFYGRATSRETDNPLLDDLAALLAAQGYPTPDPTAAFLLGGATLIIDRAIATGDTTRREELTQTLTPLIRVVIEGHEVVS
ncbi:TetR/AcrR family transcriptional regulator [Rhodococcus sp. ACT016]|uniref:TetR/AcrR family transcriptional regulator n=1 Tax=Rhodococcus sp. ACT016 TaxID=3134808 RepID=UPI003D2A6CF2